MNDLNMNRLPVPTWNQCGVNSAPKAAALPEIPGDDWGEANIAFTLPAGVGEAEKDFTAFSESGMGEAVDTYLLENATVRHALTRPKRDRSFTSTQRMRPPSLRSRWTLPTPTP